MSQFSLRSIREIPNDPFAKFTNHLAKRLSVFLNKNEIDKLENKEDIYTDGQDIDTVVRFNSLNSTKYFGFDTPYYPPFEPDGNKLRVWIRARNMGNTTRDLSYEGRICSLIGEPLLVDGTPFDDGIHSGGTKSMALRFNRPLTETENDDLISIDHANRIKVSEGLVTGISFFIRFRVFSLAQQGSANRVLFEKIDNSTSTDGVKVEIDTSGRLKFMIENGGISYTEQTATSTITTNTVYDAWFTYTKSGNIQHIYVNNVDKTLTSTSALSYHSNTTDKNLSIFTRGMGNEGGSVYGDLYDFRVYREKVVSATEVGYMYTNKLTIANIPFGQVAIANYFATYDETPGGGSFTSTSFSPTSFTI